MDESFLKGMYGGQLHAAIRIHANDYIYQIAWAIVSKENKENWKWFLELLAQDLMITNSHNWTFMSYRQKVIDLIYLCS